MVQPRWYGLRKNFNPEDSNIVPRPQDFFHKDFIPSFFCYNSVMKSKEVSAGNESLEQLVGKARAGLIYELEEALKTYGSGWVNKENCVKLINDLTQKKPVKIGGPFWGDLLDGVLYDLGMRPHTDGKHEAVWKELEVGV